MNSSKRITITTILAAGATFASITYLYLSSPNALVLSKDGEIAGIANVVRAQLQGNAFWKNQLFEARRALEWAQTDPQRTAMRKERLETLLAQSKLRLEEFDRLHPRSKPSAASEEAERLRDAADGIEQAETDQYIESIRISRIARLEDIIKILEFRNP